MNNKKITMSWLLVVMSMTVSAELRWLEEPTAQKLSVGIEKSMAVNVTRERVAFNQSLIGQAHSVFQNQGFKAESKQYWMDSDAKQLSQGVNLPLSSSTAIIRINPLNMTDKAQVIDEQQVELSMAGVTLKATTFVNAEQLKSTGMSVSEQTVALKVKVSSGDLKLKVNGLKDSKSQFVIHVFEPESDHVLAVKTAQQNHAVDADIIISADMKDAAGSVPLKVRGYVTAPNGEKAQDLKFMLSKKGDYQAVLSKLQGQPMVNGLWEVHTFTEALVNGQKVLRDASTAFAINIASAQFNGQLKADGGQVNVGIENVLGARYEISGTLLGYDREGNQKPIALMMSAQWLEAGQTSLSFDWPVALIKSSGLKAPYEITQLALKNQSLMAPVQRVEGGILINEIPEIFEK